MPFPTRFTHGANSKFAITPQSFPPVKLVDPADPFSAPLPRQHIKAGMLVEAEVVRYGSTNGTLPEGKWLAVVLTPRTKSDDDLWHLKILCRLSDLSRHYTRRGSYSSLYGRRYTTTTVRLVNPWATALPHESFAQLNCGTSDLYYRDRYDHHGNFQAIAYDVATTSAKRKFKDALQARVNGWNVTVPGWSDRMVVSNYENLLLNGNVYGGQTESERNYYWPPLKKKLDALAHLGKNLAMALALVKKDPTAANIKLVHEKLIAPMATHSVYRNYCNLTTQQFQNVIARDYNVRRCNCGHYGEAHSVYVSRHGEIYSYCETCFDLYVDSGRFVQAIPGPRANADNPNTPVWADSHQCDLWQHEESDEFRRMYAPPAAIGEYHSSKAFFTRPMPHLDGTLAKGTPFVGMELEFVRHRNNTVGLETLARAVKKKLAPVDAIVRESGQGEHYGLVERDGSVDFELVTGFGPLDIHRAAVIGLLGDGEFKGKLVSHDGGRCGLHVHLDKPTSPIHAAKLVEFYNKTENARLVKAVARRYDSGHRYARVVPEKGGTNLAVELYKNIARMYSAAQRKAGEFRKKILSTIVGRHDCNDGMTSDRYELVNFQPAKTVEIRVFRGSMVVETVIACLEFAYVSWFFARDCNDMGTDAFLEFIERPEWRADTKYLRPYLLKKGFPVWVAKPNPKPQAITCAEDEVELVDLPAMKTHHAEAMTARGFVPVQTERVVEPAVVVTPVRIPVGEGGWVVRTQFTDPCPVRNYRRIDVIHRGGAIHRNIQAESGLASTWTQCGDGTIVAWRFAQSRPDGFTPFGGGTRPVLQVMRVRVKYREGVRGGSVSEYAQSNQFTWDTSEIEAFQVEGAREAVMDGESVPLERGWLPWGGGECPVRGGSRVVIRTRSGVLGEGRTSEYYWNHNASYPDGDIVAYYCPDMVRSDGAFNWINPDEGFDFSNDDVCPVAPGTRVRVTLVSGYACSDGNAEGFRWANSESDADIARFEVLSVANQFVTVVPEVQPNVIRETTWVRSEEAQDQPRAEVPVQVAPPSLDESFALAA